VQDFELQPRQRGTLSLDTDAPRLLAALTAMAEGRAETDGFNRLILRAGLHCRLCAGTPVPVHSFGRHPIANAFLTNEASRADRYRFVLAIAVCPECGTVIEQLAPAWWSVRSLTQIERASRRAKRPD
jgi:hypothetical protein